MVSEVRKKRTQRRLQTDMTNKRGSAMLVGEELDSFNLVVECVMTQLLLQTSVIP